MLKPAHRTQTTAEEILEHWEQLAAHALAPTKISVQSKGVLPVQRNVLLELVVAPHIACVTTNTQLGLYFLQPAHGRNQGTVTVIARPAHRQGHGDTANAIQLRKFKVRSWHAGARYDFG